MSYRVTSAIPVIEGGTGQRTLTNHGVLLGSAQNPIVQTAVGTTGQVLTGVTGSDPIWSNDLITDSGTFTPTLFGSTTAGVTTYVAQNGYYTRIGGVVIAQAYISVTSATGTGTTVYGGLPFTIRNATNYLPLFTNNVIGFNTVSAIVGQTNTTTGVSQGAMPIAAPFTFTYTAIYNI